jgi:hypothetical protein
MNTVVSLRHGQRQLGSRPRQGSCPDPPATVLGHTAATAAGLAPQTTIPQAVRTAPGLLPGDAIAYRIEDGRAILTRFSLGAEREDPFGTLSEWAAPPMKRPMASFDIWDIVKVPFPYANRPIRQHRPALVVALYSSPRAPALCVLPPGLRTGVSRIVAGTRVAHQQSVPD